MIKERERELKVLPLGMSIRHGAYEDAEKLLPQGDPAKEVLKAMISEKICGIASMVNSGHSTLEWDNNLEEYLREISFLAKRERVFLIVGESGTGKESMAKVLHTLAKKKKTGPIISINCAGIPLELFESEFFGHEKGAFTGANFPKKGHIESAKGGSLFLDELGKMSRYHQNKLLRTIKDDTIRRVGHEEDTFVGDVKFIFAVQPSELNDINVNRDLLNRLNDYNKIYLPPLKERIRRDPYIIYDVLAKIQEDYGEYSASIKDEDKEPSRQVESALERFKKTLKTTDLKVIQSDMPLKDGRRSAMLAREISPKESSSGKLIHENQPVWTKESVKAWEDYLKLEVELRRRNVSISLSNEAFHKLVKYDGYSPKNFRQLENILKYAIKKATVRGRKDILLRDLPDDVVNPSFSSSSENRERAEFNTKDIPLKDILDHAKGIMASIVRTKIEEVYSGRGELKPALAHEGVDTRGYQNIRAKFARILGKDFLKKIRADFGVTT